MNRSQLQSLANERVLDAEALLLAGRWAFAYYVVGYAVECALKSCILAQMIHTGGVFTNKKFAEECFPHDFGTLVRLAGLTDRLNAELKTRLMFRNYWATVETWKETSRYEFRSQPDAEALYLAITDTADGVMQWIKMSW